MINQFFEYIKDFGEYSKSTLKSYRSDLNKFADYISSVNTDFADVNGDIVLQFIDKMRSARCADATIARMTSTLKFFYEYLLNCKIVEKNPLSRIRPPKVEKHISDTLSDNEIKLLFSQPDLSTFKGIRDRVILETLYSSGIKVSELIELKVSDIDIMGGYITCGKENRRVLLSKSAAHSAAAYLEYFDEDTLPSQYFFVNINGNKLSRQGVWKILKNYADKAGIKKQITVNCLHRSFTAAEYPAYSI